jgi:hypothetical protein
VNLRLFGPINGAACQRNRFGELVFTCLLLEGERTCRKRNVMSLNDPQRSYLHSAGQSSTHLMRFGWIQRHGASSGFSMSKGATACKGPSWQAMDCPKSLKKYDAAACKPRRLTIFSTRFKISTDVVVHVRLVSVPAPRAVGADCDIRKGIEAEALKTFMSSARVSMFFGAMPKVKNSGIEIADLGTHRLIEGIRPITIAFSLPAVHVVTIGQSVETPGRCTSQGAIAAAQNAGVEKAMSL